MSSFLFSASITLVLLSILPLSTAHPLDTDGDPILNGKDYYIVPVLIIPGLRSTPFIDPSGFTYTQKNEECPFYIAMEKPENSPGTPVRISAPFTGDDVIGYNQSLHLAFKGPIPSPCKGSPLWGASINWSSKKVYITTGDEIDSPFMPPFFITERKTFWSPLYELKFSFTSNHEDTQNVGLHKDEDGLLGLVDYSTPVVFKKAFNVDHLSTTS